MRNHNKMPAEQWHKAKELFHSALEHEPSQRTAFLYQACAGDEELRKEVERTSVQAYVKGGQIVSEYVEVESGKRNDRLELAKTIEHARREGATLIIAKLDRLARSVAFMFALRDSGVKFIVCDMPEANTLTIGLLAALAQHERELL